MAIAVIAIVIVISMVFMVVVVVEISCLGVWSSMGMVCMVGSRWWLVLVLDHGMRSQCLIWYHSVWVV